MNPILTAHRGASITHPENTLVAFREALAIGVERMEFDLRRTADGELVILHDPTVDRTTDGTGPVWELTFEHVRSLDAGSHRDASFAGARVPTLEEALGCCAEVVCNLNVYPGPNDLERVVDELVATLQACGRWDDVFVAANPDVLTRCQEVAPTLARCLLGPAAAMPDYPEQSAAFGCRNLQPSNRIVTSELVARAELLGQSVHPFYADEVDELARLLECGCAGVLTNHPARLAEWLTARGWR